MRNMKKKGFTIVELVVVVAVIAILAAVLIPTFSGIIRKANISADSVLAKSLNSALAAENATEKVDDFGDVKRVLKENGYFLANLNAKTDGCYFVWDKSINTILLVDAEDGYKIIFPDDVTPSADKADWFFAISDPAKVDAVKADGYINAQNTIASVEDLHSAFEKGGETTIHVDESLTIDKDNVFVLDKADAKITLDLGDVVIAGNNDATFAIENIPFQVKQGELNIKGGNIKATGKAYDADGEEMNNVINSEGGVVNVEGAKIETADAVLPIALTATNGIIKDTTIITGNNAIGTYNGTTIRVENCKIEADYLAFFASKSGGTASKVEIDGGVYHTTVSNLLGVYGGEIVVEDGVFNCDAVAKTFKFYNVAGGKIVLKGGTFNGVSFANLNEETLRAMCNLTECANGINVTFADGAWTLAVK